jgi:hypothetical protein
MECSVIDTDFGVGVIKVGERIVTFQDNIWTWDYFNNNRKTLLNLITWDEFKTNY